MIEHAHLPAAAAGQGLGAASVFEGRPHARMPAGVTLIFKSLLFIISQATSQTAW